VGRDGSCRVIIVEDITDGFGNLHLGFSSGQVFIGAGEKIRPVVIWSLTGPTLFKDLS
jgi:hypothetical protein